MSKQRLSQFHVGVAAEAFVAAQFARYGYDVSVQYGANQPEYDLIVAKGDKMMKVSVKGSQDGGWGLTMSHIKNADYHKAADDWLKKHGNKTVFALVQFKDVSINELPLLYLALPKEIANELKLSRKNLGDTVLRVHHVWGKTSPAYGTVDKIPAEWSFTSERIEHLLEQVNN